MSVINEFNLSKFNEICLDVIDEYETGDYNLVEGKSSYNINNEFLFDSRLMPLAKQIQGCINQYIHDSSTSPLLESSVISASWFNILGKGGIVSKHRHVESWDVEEGSVVSGAYYPYVDEDSSPLFFNLPNGIISKPVKSGQMILFPSWADHWTEKNQSEKRITVSFNTVRKSIVLKKFPNSVKEAEERLKNDSS
tara:strand:- start:56 stop:640 length:585 start_codon:yes stop_codon:yes gene_type:complete